ncbi:MAG: L-arabinose isomerase [Clostridiaceae bacterium]|nr:L-arabinose isomerase [Clostridiaceae bacterium]
MSDFKFWFITGSQFLYGEETIRQVKLNSEKIVKSLNSSGKLPWEIELKDVVLDSDSIRDVLKQASADDSCAGVITWMHTFSPAKMWIAGLKALRKPLLHLHTQFNKKIPLEEIDMDYMNLHQSAHGDREFGYICTRLGLSRKVISGYYEDEKVLDEMAVWMRSAVGVAVSEKIKCVRFGDNMRHVAVTEGDKVEAQIKLGWEVNYLPVGTLAEETKKVTDQEVDAIFDEMSKRYEIITKDIDAVKYQIRIEAAMNKIFEEYNASAFTTTFEDLYGLDQLPGLACQRMMEKGIGFAGEGDWKTACLLAVMKRMEKGLSGGCSFMEDYTYHYEDKGIILGAHMLEIDPSIGEGKVSIDVEPLGIGDRNPPARMKFKGKEGNAICVSLIDMGNRLRMIVSDVLCVKPIGDMPRLPVAQVMWTPLPDLKTASEAWIYAGGAHHTVLSYSLTAEHMRNFAEIAGIEFVHINNNTEINSFKQELLLADAAWRIK